MRWFRRSPDLEKSIREEGHATRELLLKLSKQSTRQTWIWAAVGIAVSIAMGLNIARLVSTGPDTSRVLLIAHDGRIDLWSSDAAVRTIWQRTNTYFGSVTWSDSGIAAVSAIPERRDELEFLDRTRIVIYDSGKDVVKDFQCGNVCQEPTWFGEDLFLFGEGVVRVIDPNDSYSSSLVDLVITEEELADPPAIPLEVVRVLAKSSDELLLTLRPGTAGGYGFGYNLASMDRSGALSVKPTVSSDVQEGGSNVGLLYVAQNDSSSRGATSMGWRNGHCQQNDWVEIYDIAGTRRAIQGPESPPRFNVLNWLDYTDNGNLLASWSSTLSDGVSDCIEISAKVFELLGDEWQPIEPVILSNRFDIIDDSISATLFENAQRSYVRVRSEEIESEVDVIDAWNTYFAWSPSG